MKFFIKYDEYNDVLYDSSNKHNVWWRKGTTRMKDAFLLMS